MKRPIIRQLVYYSRNTVPGGDRAMLTNMREILSISQHNNSRYGITGFLIFDKTWFVQILEGERAKVTTTYDRIARDQRHAAATIINLRDVSGRLFPNWTMGGAMRTPEVQEIHLQHGFGGPLDPVQLKPDQVVNLALDLQDFEASRRHGSTLAG